MSWREFIDAATAAAFTGEDGRTTLHCFAGMFGADWDLDAVLREIEGADDVRWSDHLLGHDLLTVTEGRRRSFDVRRPAVTP